MIFINKRVRFIYSILLFLPFYFFESYAVLCQTQKQIITHPDHCLSGDECRYSKTFSGPVRPLKSVLSSFDKPLSEDLFVREEQIKNSVKLIEYFVEKGGVDPNTTGKDGVTPLHWAAGQDQDILARKLVALGASFVQKSKK